LLKLIVEKVGSLKDILLKYQTEEEKVELKKEISELRLGDKQRRVRCETRRKSD